MKNDISYEKLSGVNKNFLKNFLKEQQKFFSEGQYILGKRLQIFEKNFANYLKIKYCTGVASGLDALIISLKNLNLPKGSEIILASNSYIACFISIITCGLKPVLIEPDINTYNIDVKKISDKVSKKTKAIMAVHLYGQPCDMFEINKICKKNNLFLIEDCAQSHGASIRGRPTGTFGDFGCFSFYPTKNLGGIGDGGAISTNNGKYYKRNNMIRNYGLSKKYHNDILGMNSRLDDLQAIFLNEKLKYLDKINNHKIKLARTYYKYLKDDFIRPINIEGYKNIFHIFPIRHKKRNKLKEYLARRGIFTDIHYKRPPNKQKILKEYVSKEIFPISEKIHNTVLSLPISYHHTRDDIEKVIEVINKF